MATKAPARPTELKVKVTSAKNLIAADSNGKSDPFAVVYTKSGSSGKDKSIKTKKIAETLAPVWNETFNLILRDRKDTLVVEVWDDDLFGKDHLGTAEIPLESLEHDKETPIVAKLNKQGEISVALTIRYNDKEIEEFQKQEEERKRIEAQKKKEEEDKKAALEAQKKRDEEEARKKKEEEDRKKKEDEDKKIALEAQKKKEEEERKKKEDEAKKAQATQPAQPAKATTAPAASPATTPATTPAPAQTPAKSTSAPAASPATAPAATKPATSATPATSSSTTQTKSTTTPAKPATKQAESEGPNYVVIGGVVAVLAIAGFAAFKYFGKN